VSFTVTKSFSPSSLSQFTSCPLAFRFSYIDRRPSTPQIASTKGTIVHSALEYLFKRDPDSRTIENGHLDLDKALQEYSTLPDLVDLDLSDIQQKELEESAHELIEKYFKLEDPTKILPIGLEVKLEAYVGDTLVRGIIDRLEIDDNGELVVTDYKTGKAPRANTEQSKMGGVNLYALLCEKVFGKVPSKVQLLYLSEPTSIVSIPTERILIGVQMKSNALHKAVATACEKGEFRANVSALCGWCSYRELCPAQGGVLPND